MPPATLESDVRVILESLPPVAAPPYRAGPLLVLAVGLPGSGKSTFCRRLAQAIDAVVLESDALRRRLVRHPTHSQRESGRLFRALRAAARRLLARGVPLIIDATSLSERERRPVYAIAEECGARLVVLHFTAPEAVIAERLRRRLTGADLADRSTADIEVYYRMAQRAEPPRHAHWQIDTSDEPATEATLQRLVEACRQPVAAREAAS